MIRRTFVYAFLLTGLFAGAVFAQPKPKSLSGPQGNVWAVAFSPDGKHIAAASDQMEKEPDGKAKFKGAQIHIWDTLSGDLKQTLTHPTQVSSLAFSPDGKLLAAGMFKEIKLFNAQTGGLVRSFKEFEGSGKSLRFSTDGKSLYSINSWFGKSEIRMWSVETGKLEKSISDTAKLEFTELAVSPDGKTAVTSCRITESGFSGEIKIWDLETGKLRSKITEPKNWLEAVAVTPDGKLVAAPVGFAIHVWDAATGKQVRQIKEFLSQVAVTADGKMLVGKINTVGGSDIKFIDLATGRTTRTVKMAHKSFGHFAMSPDGKWIAVGGGEAGAGSVQVLSVAN